MMNKKVLKNFLIDHLSFTMVYFISNLLVGLFYYISVGSNIEIMYPACLSLFVYVIFIIYRWITYGKFNSKVDKLVDNINYDLTAYTSEEKEFVELISKTHHNYMEKINSLHFESENKKHFISQWIHNMKTPISVVDLILQKTSRGEIPKEKALEDIKEENSSLLNKLEQVLNLIRLQSFTEDYVPETVDLIASLRKIINNRKSQFIYNGVFPKLEASEESVLVLSDEKWNDAMIEQIVSNAIKYSAAEGSTKNVYFTIKRENNKVLLTIRDEGIGIPEYDISRIFKPFFTGDNGRECDGSTGIGLYFCSQVAKRLGNDINVKSKVGEGTEVTITYLSKV